MQAGWMPASSPGGPTAGVTMHVIYFYCRQFFFHPSISSY